jgi:ATP-binding cassette subfamily F protein 3
MLSRLQVQNLSKTYGSQLIFRRLNLAVADKQRIGVIGRNGAGKSTLFKIIIGQEKADSGQVVINPGTRLGYLEQQTAFRPQETALEYLLRSSGQEPWRCQSLASRFQLTPEHLAQPLDNLSGGWQMRVKLTAMLLPEPNLLLLDEPTNYLDLSTQILLEQFLKTYNGSFLIISHDRYFLKNTCQETLEITANGSYHFPRPLEEYLVYKAKQADSQAGYNQKLERQAEHLQSFVDRFRYKASKAAQAQSKIKQLDKLAGQKITGSAPDNQVRIQLPGVEKRKNWSLHASRLTIGYGDHQIVANINLEIACGQKVIVLGDNGQGKTTLLRTLLGQLPPLGGKLSWLPGLAKAYYTQQSTEMLTDNEQVGTYLRQQAAPDIKTEAVLKMAGNFLFSEEDLKKPLSVLSGGEKSRLCLAGLLLGRPDVLVLDEPTSHLDFATAEALGRSLSKFNGTIIFTSHDRGFAQLLATNIIELKNGQARRYPYSYTDYLYYLESGQLPGQASAAAISVEHNKDKAAAQQSYLAAKAQQRQASLLEKRFGQLRRQQEELLAYFASQPTAYQPEKVQQLQALEAELAAVENDWLNLVN